MGEVYVRGSEVSTGVVKWSAGVSNRVSTIIKDIYIYIYIHTHTLFI